MVFVKRLIYIVGLILLLYTVVVSGFHYRFDADELFNANTIYLMMRGLRPYADFYTVYSPILHWLLSPLFWVYGATFTAVNASRIAMIGLFLVRLLFLYFLIKKVFGKRVAIIFIPLFLFDPFTVFAAMQIRPENLMMVFYTLALLIFANAVEKSSGKLFFITGLMLGLVIITNIKIIPSLTGFFLIFFGASLLKFKKENIAPIFHVINGICLSILGFFLYFLLKGYLGAMFLHVFLDPFRLNDSIQFPTTLNYFYFSNPVIYGFEGKPVNWLYALILPVAAFAGAYRIFAEKIEEKKNQKLEIVKLILFTSFVIQWLSMPFIHSVYIQYYIPLSWYYALFTAIFLDDLLFRLELPILVRRGLMIATVVFFLLLFRTSLAANLTRAKMDSTQLVAEIESLWQRIPEGIPTYPNLIFRPPVYPVLWGSTFATYMRNRYPPVYKSLEKNNVTILTGLDDTYFSYLDADSQSYILSHYVKDPSDNRFWIRKK